MSTLSAILHKEPKPFSEVGPALPRELERIITHCLRKDPARRFQHIDDVKTLLDELKEESESGKLAAVVPGGAAPARRRWLMLAAPMTVALAVLAASIAWWLARSKHPAAIAPLMRLTSDSGLTTDPALSPDGRLVAYASDRAGGDNLDIWVQQIDGGGAPLRLTSDAADESEPSFSPDGNQIVFRSEHEGGGIYIVPVLGGEPRLIAKGGRNPRFSPDGSRIAFVTGVGGLGGGSRGGLFVVPSMGGTPQQLVSQSVGASYPTWSPDGKLILFATGAYRPDDWGIVPSGTGSPASPVVLPLAELKKKAALADVVPHEWMEGDRILFAAKSGDSSHVFEIGLSPPGLTTKEWRLDPSPERMTSGTELEEMPSLATLGSRAGARRLTFASLIRSENLWSLTLDANHPRTDGKLQRLTQGSGFNTFPSISRDGTKLASMSHAAYNDEVWLLDLKTGKKLLLSNKVSVKFKPIIHPDGSRVVYTEAGDGPSLYAAPSSGGPPEKLCDKCAWPWDWSADHKRILELHLGKSLVAGGMINLETGKTSVLLERPGKNLYQFHWSPDGRWIVFMAEQAGRSQVYVAPFTGDQGPSETAWLPITDGSTFEGDTQWSPNGNWIYTRSDRDGFVCLWAYPLDPQTKRPAGKPVAVFHSHGSRLSLRNANEVSQEVSIARDKIVFNQGEITGNIWMTELGK